MSRIHRKLFPALTTTNQTIECPDICEPSCPYNCYSYPNFYYPQPPLPPPPPPPLIPTSASKHSHHINLISPHVIILVLLIGGLFLFVCYYVIIVKSCAGRCNTRGTNEPSNSDSETSDEQFIDENTVDHPIWFITTAGLQQSIINAITVCKYRKDDGLIEGTECSVCLNPFQEDETLRLLPKCSHAFHVPCIDTWLRSHTNCPLCRSSIISSNANFDASLPYLPSVGQEGRILGTIEESQMENSGNAWELASNNMAGIVRGVSENRGETGEEGVFQNLDGETILKEVLDDNGNQESEATSGNQLKDVKNGVKQVTNFDSLDSSATSNSVTLANSGAREDGNFPNLASFRKKYCEYSSIFRFVRSSSIAKYLHISPVSMKRSILSGGRMLPTRGNRGLNKSKCCILSLYSTNNSQKEFNC